MRLSMLFWCLALTLCLSLSALADSVLLNASGSNGRSASALFTLSGSSLTVDLSNTAGASAADPSYGLSALFFDMVGKPSLTAVSAAVAPGSDIIKLDGTSSPQIVTSTYSGNLGGEWAYKFNSSGLSAQAGEADYGISSTGLNVFGAADLFGGPEIAGPSSDTPDGIQLSLLPSDQVDNSALNGGMTGTNGQYFVESSARFTFKVPNTVTSLQGEISNVTFLYGTAFGEASAPGQLTVVPTPTAAAGAGAMLFVGFVRHWLKSRRKGTVF